MRSRIYKSALQLAPLFVITIASERSAVAFDELVPEQRITKSGVTYTLYPQGKLKFDFLVKRPSPKTSDILFCIPSAFTTHSNQVDGIFVSAGTVGNKNLRNPNLGGAAIIRNGQLELISSDKGTKLTDTLLADLQKTKGSLFQQFLIVENGKAASFKDKSNFQRRAIYQKASKFGIIESDRAISFSGFNSDLVELGIKNALYCDMGAWDEGWYRPNSSSKVQIIGSDKSQTARQSNWLVLRKATTETYKQSSTAKTKSAPIKMSRFGSRKKRATAPRKP